MKLGVIARGEDRGLGIQTWEVCRHMKPDRVILVEMGGLSGRFQSHPERFEDFDTVVVPVEDMATRQTAALMKDVDVVYSAETFYHWMMLEWLNVQSTASVCHLNPEFYGHHIDLHEPRPTKWWLPSSWMRNDQRLPDNAAYVPMPCPLDRWPTPRRQFDGSRPLKVLHVSGHQAMGDRNGTRLLLAAIAQCKAEMEITVTTQDGALPSPGRLPPNISYRLNGGARDNWSLYEDHDVLVMPRRYGGLCLPAIEAMGAGLAVLMSNCSPNTWDYSAAMFVDGKPGSPMKGKVGVIDTFTVTSSALANRLDHLAENPNTVRALQFMSRKWAEDHSWENRINDWHAELRFAVESFRG